MDSKFRHSMLFKLLTVVGITVFISMTVFGVFVYTSKKNTLVDGNKAHIESLTEASRGVLKTIAGAESETLTQEALQDVAKITLLGDKKSSGERDYSSSDFIWKDDGYLYAYDKDGVAVMHPFLEGKNVREASSANKEVIDGLFKTARENPNGGFYEYDFPDENGDMQRKLSFVYYFEDWDWVVGMAVYEYELEEGVGKLGLISGLASIGLVLAINLIIWVGIRKRLNMVNVLVSNLEKMSEGDLNITVPDTKDNSEIGRLARTVVHLKVSLREMLEGISSATSKVATSSDGLTTVSDRTSLGAKDMSSKVMSINKTLENQNSQLETVSSSVKDIASTMSYVANKVSSFSDGVIDSTESAVNGKTLIADATEGLTEITTSVSNMEVALRTLNEKSNNIHQVIEMIDSVSDQTKMLALNAQIEAARAGEQGRGFAVVATEVGKLAVETRTQVEEIRNLVRQIVFAMEDVSANMEKTKRKVTSGNESMSSAEKSFNDIVSSFERMSGVLQDITADVEQITSQTEEAESGIVSLLSDANQIKGMADTLETGIVSLEGNVLAINESTSNLEVASTNLNKSVSVFDVRKIK